MIPSEVCVTLAFFASEAGLRALAFLAIFSAMAAFEFVAPRRAREEAKGERWRTNFGMLALDAVLLRIVFPAAAVGAAYWAERQGLGLFNLIDAPIWLAGILAFVILDFAVWAAHVASHKVPVLWRIHRVHHADIDVDVTTGLRFHPLEIILSMFWKAGIVVLLGAPASAVLVFEIVLNGMAMFNHSNVTLPVGLDRWMRAFVVTPDMHRVHHSILRFETDSNYGFNFTLWDRMFGTYRVDPQAGHEKMSTGLPEHRSEGPSRLGWSLAFPFRRS